MIICERIAGNESDPAIALRLHQIEHVGQLHTFILAAEDMQRHRLRGKTDRGLECAIALPRDVALADGAVLHLADDIAIVVRAAPTRWISFTPRDAVSALELGYIAGNMHWKVRFEGETITVAQWAAEADIVSRVQHLIDAGQVSMKAGGESGG